ncbi:histone PARylation factor 1-like [Anneissia japonica]|uniref:histone PARylation factor 1-like n=1 Tax=Anneissia japonica TaxID=1529436 RepID=UPI0014259AB6|nr:histone PARylation factor 1-like [Anneissia japonica]
MEKGKEENLSDNEEENTIPICKYGANCYRKNPDHFKQFSHPKRKPDIIVDASPSKKRKIEEETDDKERQTSEDKDVDEDKDEDILECPPTPPSMDIKEEIEWKFKVKMPQDFYDFWEFCKTLNETSPCDALLALDLQLVGPYDVLAGKLGARKNKRPNYVLHYRYYYDPPEFQTIVKGDDDSQLHLGYYRDEPKKVPVFVASNKAKVNHLITPQGENLFAATKLHLDKILEKTKVNQQTKELEKISEALCKFAEENGYSLESKTTAMKAREKLVVAKTFHGAGIVVPVDENDVGYRSIPETNACLKKIFKNITNSKDEDDKIKKFEPLQELTTLVQFANDECDYGEGYELGLDLFSYGGEVFHNSIKNLLLVAYQLLGRGEFGEILEAHLAQRNTDDVSQLV